VGTLGRPSGRSLDICGQDNRCQTKSEALTIALNHEWFDDVMSYHLKVGMTDPVTDGGLGAGEEIIDDGYFMTQEHQTINEMGSNETSTAGNQDALAFGWRQEFDRWETRESCIGDRVGVWVED